MPTEVYNLPPEDSTPVSNVDIRKIVLTELQAYRGLIRTGAGTQRFEANNQGIFQTFFS